MKYEPMRYVFYFCTFFILTFLRDNSLKLTDILKDNLDLAILINEIMVTAFNFSAIYLLIAFIYNAYRKSRHEQTS